MILYKGNTNGNEAEYESIAHKSTLVALGLSFAAAAGAYIWSADIPNAAISYGIPAMAFLGSLPLFGRIADAWAQVSAGYTTSELDVKNSTIEQKREFFETNDDSVVAQKLAEAVTDKNKSDDISSAAMVGVALAL